jgi:hypothetical protein
MTTKSAAAALALAAAAAWPCATLAQSDELWEVTSQMSMPGMPAGMGAMTHQVCQEKASKKPALGEQMEKCSIVDYKESGNRISMTVRCPDGTGHIEHTYNAARTEYKGTMKMNTRDGDMTMTSTGRKVGSCDAKVARKKQDADQAAIKSRMDQSMAQSAAEIRKFQDESIRGCAQAPEAMDPLKLGVWAQCGEQPEQCKAHQSSGMDPGGRAEKACNASRAKLCARYQTPEGYFKAKGAQTTAKVCGVDAQAVKTSLCPKAGKSDDSLLFLARYCPVEAKPLAEKQCAGRDYTAMRAAADKPKDRYHDFCLTYLANADLQAEPRRAAKPKPTEAIQKGVSEGINKLKGLFGR